MNDRKVPTPSSLTTNNDNQKTFWLFECGIFHIKEHIPRTVYRNGNAKKDSLGSCDQRLLLLSFPQLSLSSVPSAEIPWMHTFFFFSPHPSPCTTERAQHLFLEALERSTCCCLLMLLQASEGRPARTS